MSTELLTQNYTISPKSQQQTRSTIAEFIANQNSRYTQKAYLYELRQFFQFIQKQDLTTITHQDILAYKTTLNLFKPATITWKLTVIKQFFAHAKKRGYIPQDITEGIKSPAVHQAPPDCLTLEELTALLNAPDRRSIKGKRDYALLHVMVSSAGRIGEILSAKVKDLDTYYNRPVINIMGKGGKPRKLELMPEVKEVLNDYLATRKDISKEDYLFIATPGHGDQKKHLSPRLIQRIIKLYARRALISKNITPHIIRHTTAQLELDNGANIRQIQEQLGHSSLSVTQRYTRALGSAAEKNPVYKYWNQ